MDKYIYIIGGRETDNIYPTVLRFDLETNVFQPCKALKKARYGASSCIAGSKVCAFGGYTYDGNNSDHADSLEIRDANENTSE